jgi:hypothetical protein
VECNFLLDLKTIESSHQDFIKNTTCVKGKHNKPICNFEYMYENKADQHLIHDLCRASVNPAHTPPRNHQGGAPLPDIAGQKKYKGLTPLSEDFIKFIADTLLNPLLDQVKRPDFYCIYQYFDDGCVLHKSGCKSIQYTIEFAEDAAIIVAISTHRALKACWASNNTKTASEKEKKTLRQWMACSAALWPPITAAT